MKKLYFIVGSQDLYGEECLKQVAEDSRQMVAFLNEKVGDLAEIELLPTVETSEICIQDMRKASNDDDCVGVITWMHTFSPAKMWIKGLQELRKPLLHECDRGQSDPGCILRSIRSGQRRTCRRFKCTWCKYHRYIRCT